MSTTEDKILWNHNRDGFIWYGHIGGFEFPPAYRIETIKNKDGEDLLVALHLHATSFDNVRIGEAEKSAKGYYQLSKLVEAHHYDLYHQVADVDAKAPDKLTFMRDDTGKTAWNLVDWQALEALVKVLEFGAAKYSPDNWKSCENPMARIVPSLLRHAIAIAKGEEIDPESGLPHTGHLMCNAMFLEHFRLKNNN